MAAQNVEEPAAMSLAARMYSLCLIWRTSVRTTLAMFIQLVSPMMQAMARGLDWPIMACKKMMTRMEGMLIAISAKRISTSSSQAGAKPLTQPYTTAMAVETAAATNPMNSEMRPPYQIIEKISRPMGSVPKRNPLPGGWLMCERSR